MELENVFSGFSPEPSLFDWARQQWQVDISNTRALYSVHLWMQGCFRQARRTHMCLFFFTCLIQNTSMYHCMLDVMPHPITFHQGYTGNGHQMAQQQCCLFGLSPPTRDGKELKPVTQSWRSCWMTLWNLPSTEGNPCWKSYMHPVWFFILVLIYSFWIV